MAKAKAKTEEAKEEVKKTKKVKPAIKEVSSEKMNVEPSASGLIIEADDITNGTITSEQAGISLAAGEDQTVETYARATPFGVEVWDPETKSTTFKANG
jgi:hypothetical protein